MGRQFNIYIECVNESELINKTNKNKNEYNGSRNERKNLIKLITVRWQENSRFLLVSHTFYLKLSKEIQLSFISLYKRQVVFNLMFCFCDFRN